jgi:hypothetical protein
MKFFRTSASLAIVAAFSVASALAAMAPRPPAAAAAASSSPSGNACFKTVNKKLVFPLVMCVERQGSTSTGVGNGFPWENSTGFFASFRNQYLYPANAITKVRAVADTIESLHARSVSFSGAGNHIYNSAGKGSFVRITPGASNTLVPTFALNSTPTIIQSLSAAPGGSFEIGMVGLPSGSAGFLSTCVSCAGSPDPKSPSSRDRWANIGDLSTVTGSILVDSLANVGGGTGNGIWDTGSGTACEARRAYGSGSFANPNHLTTALGVDTFDMVWVFQGLAPPPSASVEQQIAEIIRLLLTPEGLRCSFLDLTTGDSKIGDDPIAFPDGASIDPISPQVSNGGTVTGDELEEGRRRAGYDHP